MLFLCNKDDVSEDIEQRLGKKEEGCDWKKKEKKRPTLPCEKLQFRC